MQKLATGAFHPIRSLRPMQALRTGTGERKSLPDCSRTDMRRRFRFPLRLHPNISYLAAINRRNRMPDRSGIFAGDDPFDIAGRWMREAAEAELNDPDAMALATVDAGGRPNVRMVLLKDIEANGFVFYTNLGSIKARELAATGLAAIVIHWKSIRRQIRARGRIEQVGATRADAYFATRSPMSRIGAWASRQSEPLRDRAQLEERASRFREELGENPARPDFWGGFRVVPSEIEFWANGDHRLHDRFRWTRGDESAGWAVARLYP